MITIPWWGFALILLFCFCYGFMVAALLAVGKEGVF